MPEWDPDSWHMLPLNLSTSHQGSITLHHWRSHMYSCPSASATTPRICRRHKQPTLLSLDFRALVV